MKSLFYLPIALCLELTLLLPAGAKELAELKVLYVGNRRAEEYVELLRGKVAQAESKERKQFAPADADSFDVVMLDWPQGEIDWNGRVDLDRLGSPLGAREKWNKPTVLLGSAGLNLAMAWQLKAGSGCTCLEPLAYDLREHELFLRPLAIDRGKLVSIPTPEGFVGEIKSPEIDVLPLVADRQKHWHPGWCTHAKDFAIYPDIEFIAGGVNKQTPTSAALWRQGNLFQFGFDQSPTEMNEIGRTLLINAIAYISHFSEDRPIAYTPSVFVGRVAQPRRYLARYLRSDHEDREWFNEVATPAILEKAFAFKTADERVTWLRENTPYFHPNDQQQLEIDEDLLVLGVPFDAPEFFERVLADLASADEAKAGRARRLLTRYVPSGPKDATAATWTAWWKENQPYAFGSDDGDYRWYVDPLAKRRGVPQSELRSGTGPTARKPFSSPSNARQARRKKMERMPARGNGWHPMHFARKRGRCKMAGREPSGARPRRPWPSQRGRNAADAPPRPNACTMTIPKFKYNLDPIAAGSIEPADTECACCHQRRGFIYVGPVYSTETLDNCICPWCIADGSAHEEFEATFTDEAGVGGYGRDKVVVPLAVVQEVACRTPGFTAWQQEQWLACCGDAAAFLGRAGRKELERKWPDAIDSIRAESGQSDEDWPDYFDVLDRDGSPTAYVFQCLHCGRHLGYSDCD